MVMKFHKIKFYFVFLSQFWIQIKMGKLHKQLVKYSALSTSGTCHVPISTAPHPWLTSLHKPMLITTGPDDPQSPCRMTRTHMSEPHTSNIP